MSALRIGLVGHTAVGGSGIVAAQLAGALSRHGADVHLFSTGAPPRGVDGSGVRCHIVTPPTYPVLDAPPWTVAMAGALADGVLVHDLDVIHVHYALPWAVSAQLALGLVDRPVRLVVTLHGTDVTGIGSDPAYALTLRGALRRADVVTAPSDALSRAAVTSRLVVTPPRVVPNFVDTDAFGPDGPRALADGRPRIVHVSNYRPVKRATWLVDALVAARQTHDAELLLVGDGPSLASVLTAAEDAGVAHAVRSVGEVDDPAPWLRSASVFALPSAEESFGLSALEAMACGLPVVGCAVGGLPEVVQHGRSGALVDADDPSAFAAAVASLLDDLPRRDAWGRAARARAQSAFPESRALSLYLDAYDPHLSDAPLP